MLDLIVMCLSLGFYCCDKHHDQRQLEEEEVYFAYISISQSIIEESEGRNSGEELGSQD